jgi:hypothetical protein
MHGAEVLIPIIMFASGFAMIFGIVYLRTKENLAMVEKGMNPKDRLNRPAPFRSLKWGLLLLGAGLGLLIAFFVDMNLPYRIEPAGIYFALIAMGGGLGLIGSYFVEKKHWYDKSNGNGE